MGLGYCPGSVCIVSEYRLKHKSTRLLQRQERLLQLALHELGHNFSLPHCPNVNCLMVAAKGKMTLDGHKYYCSKCSAVLTKKGILLRDRQRV
jgi:archaemetzincin